MKEKLKKREQSNLIHFSITLEAENKYERLIANDRLSQNLITRVTISLFKNLANLLEESKFDVDKYID